MDLDKTCEEVRACFASDSTSSGGFSATFKKLEPWDHADGLPKFSIRALSPTSRSRSPSPIENVTHLSSSMQTLNLIDETDEPPEADSVSLEEINAQINAPLSFRPNRSLSLDTIFEGVFLETPPRRLDRSRSRYDDGPNNVVRSSLSFFSTLEEEEKLQPN